VQYNRQEYLICLQVNHADYCLEYQGVLLRKVYHVNSLILYVDTHLSDGDSIRAKLSHDS
jgi:hypothetical protein